MLEYLGIDPATIDPGTDYLVDRSVTAKDLVIPSFTSRREIPVTNVQKIDTGRHLFGAESGRIPPYFITLNGLRRHGWKQIPAGWLVQSSRPLTSDQIADARDAAAEAGLTIETRRESNPPTEVMAIATAAGALLALAILAMTVGLIRGESAGDLRTLTAAGATSGIRRTLTATTAGALALLGAILGVAGAYVVMLALYHDDLGYLSDVPVLYLALAVIGVPLAAAAAGWLVAGREPPANPPPPQGGPAPPSPGRPSEGPGGRACPSGFLAVVLLGGAPQGAGLLAPGGRGVALALARGDVYPAFVGRVGEVDDAVLEHERAHPGPFSPVRRPVRCRRPPSIWPARASPRRAESPTVRKLYSTAPDCHSSSVCDTWKS